MRGDFSSQRISDLSCHRKERRLLHIIFSHFVLFHPPDVCNHLANKFNFSFGRDGRLHSSDFVRLSRLGPPRLQQCLPNKRKDRTGVEVNEPT